MEAGMSMTRNEYCLLLNLDGLCREFEGADNLTDKQKRALDNARDLLDIQFGDKPDPWEEKRRQCQ